MLSFAWIGCSLRGQFPTSSRAAALNTTTAASTTTTTTNTTPALSPPAPSPLPASTRPAAFLSSPLPSPLTQTPQRDYPQPPPKFAAAVSESRTTEFRPLLPYPAKRTDITDGSPYHCSARCSSDPQHALLAAPVALSSRLEASTPSGGHQHSPLEGTAHDDLY